MADDSIKLLSNLETRIKQLIFVCETLKEENSSLVDALQIKEAEIALVNKNLDELNTKYKNLKLARAMSTEDTNTDTDEAKQRFNKLVREIDKCIALLNV